MFYVHLVAVLGVSSSSTSFVSKSVCLAIVEEIFNSRVDRMFSYLIPMWGCDCPMSVNLCMCGFRDLTFIIGGGMGRK